jgi:hypothetical protein
MHRPLRLLLQVACQTWLRPMAGFQVAVCINFVLISGSCAWRADGTGREICWQDANVVRLLAWPEATGATGAGAGPAARCGAGTPARSAASQAAAWSLMGAHAAALPAMATSEPPATGAEDRARSLVRDLAMSGRQARRCRVPSPVVPGQTEPRDNVGSDPTFHSSAGARRAPVRPRECF